MIGLAILIPVALALGLIGLAAFFWAIRSRQFDDLDGAALRILNDEGPPPPPVSANPPPPAAVNPAPPVLVINVSGSEPPGVP